MQVSNGVKQFLHALLFFVVLLVLLLVSSQLFLLLGKKSVGKVQDRNTNITGIQIEEEDTIDVIIIGDSLSYTSISPMQLFDETGVTSYICGQSAQRIFETYAALENALKTQSPKLVMLETNLLYRYKEPSQELEYKFYEDAQNVFPILRYHNLWKQAFYGSTDTRNDYKGFVIRDWSKSYSGSADYMIGSITETREVNDEVRGHLENLIRLCEEGDIPLLLYSTPSPKCYNAAKHEGLVQLANDYGLDYIDLNESVDEIGIDWKTDTADKGDHLNLYGAQKVTSYIGPYLAEKYSLTDYRSTEIGAKWAELVEAYKADIEERYKKK